MLRFMLTISLPCLMLAGCANVATTPPGTPLTQVEAKFGNPTMQCTDKAGQARVIWSQQPMGQYAWGGSVDAQGRVGVIQPILTDEHFDILKTGTWTPDEVRCEFGPPARIGTVGLPSVRQIVWSYRYKQNHTWDSLMYVYFGQDGRHVTRFHPGPDPLYEHDRFGFW